MQNVTSNMITRMAKSLKFVGKLDDPQKYQMCTQVIQMDSSNSLVNNSLGQ